MQGIFFIHAFTKYLLSAYYVSDTIEAARDRRRKSSVKNLCLRRIYILAMHTHILTRAQLSLEVNRL